MLLLLTPLLFGLSFLSGMLGLGVAFEGVPESAAGEHLDRALESSANSTWAAALALGVVRARSGGEKTTRTLAALARRARDSQTAPACAAAVGLVAESHGGDFAGNVLTELLRHPGGGVAPLAARGLVAAFLGAGAWAALDAGWHPGPWGYVLGADRTVFAEKCANGLDGCSANR